MNGKKHYLPVSGFYIVGLLALFSCSEKARETQNKPILQVVKTQTDIDYKGGTVVIQTNVNGVEARSRDAWLKAETSESQVRLTAEANPAYESRTTVVSLRHGEEVQEVPVTQMGVISIADVYSYDFPLNGGAKAFLWKTDQEFQITGLDPSWLSYEIKGDSIFFKSGALGIYDDAHSDTVHVTAGTYYNKKVVFGQPPLSYKAIPGEYTLEYTRGSSTTKMLRADVSLAEKEAGKTFTLKGLAFDITVLFDADRPGIAIKSQFLKKVGTQKVWLSAWEVEGNGYLKGDIRFGLAGQWNGSKKDIEFTMVPDGFTDGAWKDGENPVITRGFILWGSGEYTAGGESRFVNMKFIKKN